MSKRTKPFAGSLLLVVVFVVASGCKKSDSSGDDGGSDGSMSMCIPRTSSELPDPGRCSSESSDYAPCEKDEWEECVSDDGDYRQIETTVSTVARVAAFERIGSIIFDPKVTPSVDDFLEARLIYQEEDGLDSRVVRRYDPHFSAPEGTNCENDGVPMTFPDYCTGPAQIQPILLESFTNGIAGMEARRQAGRIEGALLRFLYVSTYKEGFTCTTKAKDCDSSWAYYTGGESARGGVGLAGLVDEVDPYAHDRAWDGVLAVRCWRDLDDSEVAENLELRDKARAQYDRAVLDGVAALVKDRLESLKVTSGQEREYFWGFLQALAPVLDREAKVRSSSMAKVLSDELKKVDPSSVDVDAAIGVVETLFDCP